MGMQVYIPKIQPDLTFAADIAFACRVEFITQPE